MKPTAEIQAFLEKTAKEAGEQLEQLQVDEAELVQALKKNRERQRLMRAYMTPEAIVSISAKVEVKAAIDNATPDNETELLAAMVKRGVKLPTLIEFILVRLQQATSQQTLQMFLKEANWKGSSELLRTTLYRMTDKRHVLFREVDDANNTIYGLTAWKK